MINPEYLDRETVARTTLDAGGDPIFAQLDIHDLIRTAGNSSLYDDVLLSQESSPNKQDGPRSALYLVGDYRVGVILVAQWLSPNTVDAGLVSNDRQIIKDAVQDRATKEPVLSKDLFALANNITTLFITPGFRGNILTAGVELRVSPGNKTYPALLVPTYFRKAPKALQAYISGLKRLGRDDDTPEEFKDMAYTNDARRIARLLALSAVYHVIREYDERDALEVSVQ